MDRSSRPARTRSTLHEDERKCSAIAFLRATVAHYAGLGVKIKRLLTDNGPAYAPGRSIRPARRWAPSRVIVHDERVRHHRG